MADPLEPLATGLFKDLGRPFTWDGGMSTALLTFEIGEKDEVVAAVGRHLDVTWTSETIDGAPDVVASLISGLGGLRPGQWIMHSKVDDGGPFLVAVFWPWGSGSPISLRVGVVGGDDAADARLKSWMGIA